MKFTRRGFHKTPVYGLMDRLRVLCSLPFPNYQYRKRKQNDVLRGGSLKTRKNTKVRKNGIMKKTKTKYIFKNMHLGLMSTTYLLTEVCDVRQLFSVILETVLSHYELSSQVSH